MLIINALIINKIFRMVLNYIGATIQAYQAYRIINNDIQFQLDLVIDEITVTINERSDNFTSGVNTTLPKVINPYARGNKLLILEAQEVASIRAIGKREHT